MSVVELNTLMASLQNIPVAHIKKPTMPIENFIQEAENLYSWCQNDKDEFSTIGITEEFIEELIPRAGALRQAESNWSNKRFTKKDAQRIWIAESQDAYELRAQLLHHFHFAYRQIPDLANRVSEISDGNSHADMIQDLSDLAVLGTQHSEHLTSINVDLDLLNQASETADRLSEVWATANAEDTSNGTNEIRNRAYTYLKEVVDEIRTAGQYLFWRDKERLEGYSSAYRKKSRISKKDNIELIAS